MMSVLGIGFSQLGAWWARNEVKRTTGVTSPTPRLVAGANLSCFAVFWVLKLIVFNRIFKVDTDRGDRRASRVEEAQRRASRGSS